MKNRKQQGYLVYGIGGPLTVVYNEKSARKLADTILGGTYIPIENGEELTKKVIGWREQELEDRLK